MMIKTINTSSKSYSKKKIIDTIDKLKKKPYEPALHNQSI